MSLRRISLFAVLIVLMFTLCGCSSGTNQESGSLQLAIASMYVPDGLADSLETGLKAEKPELYFEERGVVINAISTGDSEKDPEMAMAGMTKIMAMMTSGEIELFICDSENARRFAESGENYIPISDLYSEEEITALNLQTVSVPVFDEDGNETGEMSTPCGIDLSTCTLLTENMYRSDMAAYVFVNSTNVDQAKAVIEYLAAAR